MGEITQLLSEWRSGNRESETKLFELLLPDLRRMARYILRNERHHTLQGTEVVDQMYVRMVAAKNRDWRSRQHFFAIAARIMRRYLIDYARRRPGAEIISMEKMRAMLPADSAQLDAAMTVDRVLDELAEVNPEWSSLVEVKYFLGLTDQEAADALGLKLRSMQRMWREARQWLQERIEGGPGRGVPGQSS